MIFCRGLCLFIGCSCIHFPICCLYLQNKDAVNDLDWQLVRLGLLVCYASNKLRQTLTLRYRLAVLQFTTINLLVNRCSGYSTHDDDVFSW